MISDEGKIVKCKGCGADIFFEQGIPWYAKAVPVLLTDLHCDFVRDTGYVSHFCVIANYHFINCRNASDFSRAKR